MIENMLSTLGGKGILSGGVIESYINIDTSSYMVVENTPFISYEEISEYFGVTQGNLNTTEEANKWIRFTLDGKELYVSKVAIRANISWDHLYSKGLVYGTNNNGLYPTGTPTNQYRTITLNGKLYKARLLKGSDTDPHTGSTGYDVIGSQNSEWSRLFYPIITNDPNIKSYTGPLLASYTEADLQMRWVSEGMTPGSYAWCQETPSTSTGSRVRRGTLGPSYLNHIASSSVGTYYGWRCCLEEVI